MAPRVANFTIKALTNAANRVAYINTFDEIVCYNWDSLFQISDINAFEINLIIKKTTLASRISLVMRICEIGSDDIFQSIMDTNGYFEFNFPSGKRPIHIVNTLEKLQYLINNGVDLMCADEHGNQKIHILCMNNNLELLKVIIERNVNLECCNNMGMRPIHFACICNSLDIVKLLIKKGVDLECNNKINRRPIHYACKYGSLELIQFMINCGVDVDCQDEKHVRPIHLICKYNTLEVLKNVVDYFNRSLEEPILDSLLTPLHLLCNRGITEMVKVIVDRGVNLECADCTGYRPIHYASMRSLDLLSYLVECGADIETKSNMIENYPIHVVCMYGDLNMFKYIYERGANLESENILGHRPIHLLCRFGAHIDWIKYAISLGINLECEDKNGKRPIHYICQFGTLEMLNYLPNVELNCADNNGKYPIDYAQNCCEKMKFFAKKLQKN